MSGATLRFATATACALGQVQSSAATDQALGQALITNAGCVHCHDDDSQPSPAPVLFVHRPRAAWLKRWLAAPHEAKPGTLMPDLLAGFSERKREKTAEALLHYLLGQTSDTPPIPTPTGDAANGAELFKTSGCAACHGINYHPDFLNAKYSEASLSAFLFYPLAARPSGRMPRIPMTRQEASDLAAHLLAKRPAVVEAEPRLRRGLVGWHLRVRGKSQFKSLGCIHCHSPGKRRSSAPALKQLAGKHNGCLSAEPVAGVPFYGFSDERRAAIKSALTRLARPRSALAKAHERMLALNCVACHSRETLGGPPAANDALFLTTAADLGDEGRRPPDLTGVGAKLTEPALRRVLRGDGAIRPYMTTRMPDFGEVNSVFLSSHLATADARTGVRPTPDRSRENEVGRNLYGRELIGTMGLGCIVCHQLGGHKSLGIQGTDLAHAPDRLRPEWFRDYLIEPARFRPGTRMPSFWPNGKATSKVLGGNTERQIDSLWVYLKERDQTRLPIGLEDKGSFELIPDGEPIVFRTFMESAGSHAIAVGFPEGAHAAFDAEQVRWALLWRGKFLDAESTWDDRFTPLAKPLGLQVVTLPSGPAVAALANLQQPWPSGGLQFRGYRRSGAGTPTFLYQLGQAHIEDTLIPAAGGFRRSMKFSGGQGQLWVRLAVAAKFTNPELDVWTGDDAITIGAPTGRIRVIGGRSELLVPVEFDADKNATLGMEWRW